MKVTLWGTRGSLATPGPETARYGGNTSCVGVRGDDGTVLVLDAGTGIRALGKTIDASVKRIDILLTHLHMDHIQGLGFFAPLFRDDVDVRIWGPVSGKASLRERLMRYLSPPLFPVSLRELPCTITLHEVPCDDVRDRRIPRVVGARVPPGPDGRLSHFRRAGQRARVPAGPRAGAGDGEVPVAAARMDVRRRDRRRGGSSDSRQPISCRRISRRMSVGDTARSIRRWISRRSPESSISSRFITIPATPTPRSIASSRRQWPWRGPRFA